MSTAELGLTLAEMIRQDKIHAIWSTGANLEEDIFNLVAHDFYVRVPGYRYFTKDDEEALLKKHLNRVTDTCIPEEEAMRRIENSRSGERRIHRKEAGAHPVSYDRLPLTRSTRYGRVLCRRGRRVDSGRRPQLQTLEEARDLILRAQCVGVGRQLGLTATR